MRPQFKLFSMRFGGTVRWRLTLWYTLVLFLSFVLFGAVVDRLVKKSLYSQIDHELADALAMVTGAIDRIYKEEGNPSPARLQDEIDELSLPSQIALRLTPAEGQAFNVNIRSFPRPFLEALEDRGLGAGRPITMSDGSISWRLCQGSGRGAPGYHVFLACNLALIETQLAALRWTLFIALPLILLFAAASGYFLAGRALKPVIHMAAQARHIEANALEQRLAAAEFNNEFGQLAQVLNDLFARLEKAFQQQRQFLSDAAHELRTPAAILRSQADVALEKLRSAGEYAETLGAMRTEAEHLSAIVDDLLLIARAEAAQLPIARNLVDLMEIADESCRAVRPLAESRNLVLNWRVGEEVSVHGDPRLLRRAIMNLLTNAVKYTPPGGSISVAVAAHPPLASLVVVDTGRGVEAEDLPRIFDRFYRGAGRAGTDSEGAGLGLAIVKMIAELHGGRVSVASDSEKGSTFTLSVPLSNLDEAIAKRNRI
jgi:heavy metal sensor kinase